MSLKSQIDYLSSQEVFSDTSFELQLLVEREYYNSSSERLVCAPVGLPAYLPAWN